MAATSHNQLCALLAAQWKCSERTARARVNRLFRLILARANHGPVTIWGFGRIYVYSRKAYRKRSPRGEIETIPAARLLKFKAAKRRK